VRSDLRALLENVSLTTIGLGVAFGYALVSFATGVGQFVDGLLTHTSSSDDGDYGQALTWRVGHRVLSLDTTLIGAVEIVVVLAVAYYVRRAGTSTARATT
jgi:hypothetical protein